MGVHRRIHIQRLGSPGLPYRPLHERRLPHRRRRAHHVTADLLRIQEQAARPGRAEVEAVKVSSIRSPQCQCRALASVSRIVVRHAVTRSAASLLRMYISSAVLTLGTAIATQPSLHRCATTFAGLLLEVYCYTVSLYMLRV